MIAGSFDWALLEKPYYPIWEIVKYWCEIPDDYSMVLDRRTRLPLPDPKYPRVEVRTLLLTDAIETHQLAHEVAPDKKDKYIIGEGIQWPDRIVRRDVLKAWFERYRHEHERPPFLFWQDDPEDEPLPDWILTHDTKLLRVARWVIKTWWEGKDPDQGPTKELVVEKLQTLDMVTNGELPKLTKNEAEAVDLVTRPDSRRRSAPDVPIKERSSRKG